MSSVYACGVGCLLKEILEEVYHLWFDFMTAFSVEARAKAIWSQAGLLFHLEENISNFIFSYRVSQGG
jgi:hypothetical protein